MDCSHAKMTKSPCSASAPKRNFDPYREYEEIPRDGLSRGKELLRVCLEQRHSEEILQTKAPQEEDPVDSSTIGR